MANVSNRIYKPIRGTMTCIHCDDYMTGIYSHDARTVCEDCGGNTTEFNKNNPYPGKAKEAA